MKSLRDIRLGRGLTQAQLASLAHLRTSTIEGIESGRKRHLPDVRTCCRIADVLRVPLDRIIAAIESKPTIIRGRPRKLN